MYERVRKQNIDVIEKISWMMIIMVIISNAAITYQFSSRYVAVGLAPLIIIGTSLSKQNNMFDRFGNISGIFFGLMSLCSYYFF